MRVRSSNRGLDADVVYRVTHYADRELPHPIFVTHISEDKEAGTTTVLLPNRRPAVWPTRNLEVYSVDGEREAQHGVDQPQPVSAIMLEGDNQ